MGVLEQISQMKSQGIGDNEIVKKLQEQGISPKQINDALNQAEIKKAVGGEEYYENAPQPQEFQEQQPYPAEQEYNQGAQQGGEYYEEYHPQQGYDMGFQPTGMDTNTVMEISEQVFSEKTQKMQKQVKELSEFKAVYETKIENLSERIKKIESIIDKLEIAILEKVGSYGRNLESVKKEMSMMQDSFGKMIPSLASKHHQTHHENREQHHAPTEHKTQKKHNPQKHKSHKKK